MTYTPSYAPTSCYAQTPVLGQFLGYFVPIAIPPAPSDQAYLIHPGRYVARPDLIAYDFYGNDNLWWVFGVRNGLEDPVFDIVAGMALIIPAPAYIQSLIGST